MMKLSLAYAYDDKQNGNVWSHNQFAALQSYFYLPGILLSFILKLADEYNE